MYKSRVSRAFHYNELFEISNFRSNEQDNTCDNRTSQTERFLG